MNATLKPFFDAAIDNVDQFGDTDIFPFPIENHILRDKKAVVVQLLLDSYSTFEGRFVENPPSHISTLAPVGPSGFRWATQQDPFWNAFLLGVTLSIARDIEASRIGADKHTVFSYRLSDDVTKGKLFREDVSWRDFINHSIKMAQGHKHVVLCDISDCYQRIYHHRLDNALMQLPQKNAARRQIMKILEHFSSTKSYGLPVGGPAARILVELVLNLTDQLLKLHQVKFCRYADDYHIFVDTIDEAYEKLFFISEKFLRNDGLTLQKSKTRIMSFSEFVSSQSLLILPENDAGTDVQRLFGLKLRFDPYAANAIEQFEELKSELRKIDILGLLNLELAKTRVHGALTKKLVSAVRYLDVGVMENAILTLVGNLDSLYPIFPVVAVTIKSCFEGLPEKTREYVCAAICERVIGESYLLQTELHASFAVRILSEMKTSDNEDALVSLHNRFRGPLVRRDVILTMAKWREFPWLSDQINEYAGASPWERRAFIIASYFMGDAGDHWRDHMKSQFNQFELIVRDWASDKARQSGWKIPI
ncbi:MAG: RNA-directed DNA polymerase [Stellaceae bacterium]